MKPSWILRKKPVQDEVERCRVVPQDKRDKGSSGLWFRILGYARGVTLFSLHEALSDPNFLGYEYENGRICADPMLYECGGYYGPTFVEGSKPVHPVAVLFKK